MKRILSLAALSVTAHGSPSHYGQPVAKEDNQSIDDAAQWTMHQDRSCWRDVVRGVRALDHGASHFDASFATPARCRDACRAEGYIMAAVEYGHECWCGHSLAGDTAPVDPGFCDHPCTGDEQQMCGGYGYMNVWTLDTDALAKPKHEEWVYDWNIVACYKDVDANNRQLPFQPPKSEDEPERARTVEGCIAGCAASGFDYAGLENGQECWCGHSPPPALLKGGRCDVPCKGDAKHYCGGRASLLVFARPEVNDGESHEPENHTAAPPVEGQTSLARRQEADAEDVGFPKLPKLPLPKLPKLPDWADIIKKIKPIIGHLFDKIHADVTMSKKSSDLLLDHIPTSADGPEMDAFLRELLEGVELDAANPVGDALGKVKSIIEGLFNKIKTDMEGTKTAVLLLLDHLPGQSSLETIDAE